MTEGRFIVYEQDVDAIAALRERRVVLWDVGAKELLVGRGHVDIDIGRRISGTEVAEVHLHGPGGRSRIVVVLTDGERFELIDVCALRQAETAAQMLVKVTGAPLVRH